MTSPLFQVIKGMPPVWEVESLCSTSPVKEIWVSRDRELRADAARVCQVCPAMEVCLQTALVLDKEMGPQEGVWGGKTPLQRKQMAEYQEELERSRQGFLQTFRGEFLNTVVEGETQVDILSPVIQTWVEVTKPVSSRFRHPENPYIRFEVAVWYSKELGVHLGLRGVKKEGHTLYSFPVEDLPSSGRFIVDDGITTHRKVIPRREWHRIVHDLGLEAYMRNEK